MTRTQRIEFEGSQGHLLAARLEVPPDQPDAYALFAHCFTCSKDVFAANRISKALSERGFGVLRFDFTGLGQSGGDFANTNFSSNVQDLVSAANFMRREFQAPRLLVGHSLGGAAVLSAAHDVDEVEAVATIAAPYDPSHIEKHLTPALDTIEREGEAEVELGGRPFTVTRQFLEDVRSLETEGQIANLGKALLIFHSPTDETVGIDNAGKLFVAARHPKSFVSLDGADHLLSRHADSTFVAHMIACWSARYLGSS